MRAASTGHDKARAAWPYAVAVRGEEAWNSTLEPQRQGSGPPAIIAFPFPARAWAGFAGTSRGGAHAATEVGSALGL